jgi:hypothetical protein
VDVVRIGTWNVQYARGVEKNRRRVALLRSRRAAVWVLTETHDDLDLSATHEGAHSDQRYATPGGRWTTIWSLLPVLESLETSDPTRCVAVRLDGGAVGELVVYGTVLPSNGDLGPDPDNPSKGWTEFPRVARMQAADWRRLRQRHPDATLIVAGDLNHDLGGRHYYGTRAGRELLTSELASAGLVCLTMTSAFEPGDLEHPPIDHVCAGPGKRRTLSAEAEGWDCTVDGARLSDHCGVLASLELAPVRSWRGPG